MNMLDIFVNAISTMSITTKALMIRANEVSTNEEMKQVEAEIKKHYKRYGRMSKWGEARWGTARISPVCVYHHEMRFRAYQ